MNWKGFRVVIEKVKSRGIDLLLYTTMRKKIKNKFKFSLSDYNTNYSSKKISERLHSEKEKE